MAHDIRSLKRGISRRTFLRLTAAGAMALGTNALAVLSEKTSAHALLQNEGEQILVRQVYQEAPMLASLVEQGLLPPVDERLPETPRILPVLQETGRYDGVMNRAFRGVSDRWGPTKMVDHTLAWFDQNLNLVPHLCESWESSTDARQWTFHLRPGLRWSDGVEFTSEDVAWWYQHVLLDTRIFSTPPSPWRFNGQVMTLEALDRYTIRMSFAQPNVLFLYAVTRQSGASSCICPSHYMRRYHIDFTSDPAGLQAEAIQAGYSDWAAYYRENRSYWFLNPHLPVLGPWMAQNSLSDALFVMVRNPYYFCVDADGRQLPYNDYVTHDFFDTNEAFLARVQSGAIDFQARHANLGDYNQYKAGEATGGYQVLLAASAQHVALQLNLTTQNSRLRAFFQDVRVRQALSLAVDRNYLNAQFYGGLATPRQYSPLSRSPQYYPALSNAFINYDPGQANALLDAAGYTARDHEGYRLWKDGSGERIRFTIEGTADGTSAEGMAPLKTLDYFAAVGIEVHYQVVDRGTYYDHCWNNQIEAAWWGGDRSILPLATPGIFLGTILDRPWAVAWGMWRNNPSSPVAEQPPAGHWIWTIWSKWDQIQTEPDEAQRNALFQEILDIWAQQLPMIGYLGELPQPVIIKNGLRNYAPGYPYDDMTGDEQLLNPETYYWNSNLVPLLTINHSSGRPGSFFTLTGSNYPPNSTAIVSINGRVLQTFMTDPAGNVELILNTSQAALGAYEVTVSVNPTATVSFELSEDAPFHAKEGDGPEILVPGNLIIRKVYLPLVER